MSDSFENLNRAVRRFKTHNAGEPKYLYLGRSDYDAYRQMLRDLRIENGQDDPLVTGEEKFMGMEVIQVKKGYHFNVA